MIPKIIHYCWFGENEKPDYVKRCIDSWRRYCPDYEIIEWNESNFNTTKNIYCHEAYKAKTWAFVSDYARLVVLYKYGGIYMDTDVEVVKSFDPLLHWGAFLCFERNNQVSVGTFGVKKHSVLVGKMIQSYENRHFYNADSTLNLTTNLSILTPILVKHYSLRLNGNRQVLNDDILVLPMEAFIAKSMFTGWILMDKSTYAIHHYAGSWTHMDADQKEWAERRSLHLRNYIKQMEPILDLLARSSANYEVYGMKTLMKKICRQIIRKLGGGR